MLTNFACKLNFVNDNYIKPVGRQTAFTRLTKVRRLVPVEDGSMVSLLALIPKVVLLK